MGSELKWTTVFWTFYALLSLCGLDPRHSALTYCSVEGNDDCIVLLLGSCGHAGFLLTGQSCFIRLS